MSGYTFSRNYLPAIVNYTGDVIFNYAGSGGINFDIELGPTLSRFRVITTAGASLFVVNNSGDYIYSQTSQKFIADTSDNADSKAAFLCGGGNNTTARGALVAPCGNEYSGANGVLYLHAGDASSAFVDIRATTATSPTIRFTLTATEQWRMSGVDFIGYDTVTQYNQITRVDNLGRLILCGGTNSSSSNGASLSLGGATYGGTVGLIAGNVPTGHLTYHAPHASARHMFLIASVEQLRIESGFVFSNMVAGNESTGAGSAALGTNCPAVTASAPYKWLKIKTQDGSTAYIPAWK